MRETIRVAAVADLHGHLPTVPDCDLLVVAGDLGPTTRNYHATREGAARWLEREFAEWVGDAGCPTIVVAGNHDIQLEQHPELLDTLPVTYLLDTSTTVHGLKIHGSPWTPTFGNWAFMESEERLAERFAKIPDDVDVLVTHGPPFRTGDLVDHAGRPEHCGSTALRDRLRTVKPQLHVFGHLHLNGGTSGDGWANVAHVDESYRPTHPVRVFEVDIDNDKPR